MYILRIPVQVIPERIKTGKITVGKPGIGILFAYYQYPKNRPNNLKILKYDKLAQRLFSLASEQVCFLQYPRNSNIIKNFGQKSHGRTESTSRLENYY